MSNKLLSFIFKNNKYVGIPKESHKHLYDNQISGLTAGTTGDAIDELAQATSDLNTKLNGLLISQEKDTGELTIEPNAFVDVNVSPTIPDGYKVASASLMQIGSANTWLLCTFYRVNETQYKLYVRNMYTGARLAGSYVVKYLLAKIE